AAASWRWPWLASPRCARTRSAGATPQPAARRRPLGARRACGEGARGACGAWYVWPVGQAGRAKSGRGCVASVRYRDPSVLIELLRKGAADAPDQPLVISADGELSY